MPLTVERRALIYIRVSSKKQADNFSLEYQEKDCTQYAQKEGTKPVGCYRDVGSGLFHQAPLEPQRAVRIRARPGERHHRHNLLGTGPVQQKYKGLFRHYRATADRRNHPAPVIRRGKVRSPLGGQMARQARERPGRIPENLKADESWTENRHRKWTPHRSRAVGLYHPL